MHNKLGRFCEHKQYADAVEVILKTKKIKYKRETEIPIKFAGGEIKGNRLDFLIEDKIPLEIKAERFITSKDYVQMKRYLRATEKKLGIIVNFREKSLKPKRIINPQGEE